MNHQEYEGHEVIFLLLCVPGDLCGLCLCVTHKPRYETRPNNRSILVYPEVCCTARERSLLGKAFSESGFLRKLSYRTSPATAAYRLIRVLTAATKLW